MQNSSCSDTELKNKMQDLQTALHRKLLTINSLIRISSRGTASGIFSRDNLKTYKLLRKNVDFALSKCKTTISKFETIKIEDLTLTYQQLLKVYKES